MRTTKNERNGWFSLILPTILCVGLCSADSEVGDGERLFFPQQEMNEPVVPQFDPSTGAARPGSDGLVNGFIEGLVSQLHPEPLEDSGNADERQRFRDGLVSELMPGHPSGEGSSNTFIDGILGVRRPSGDSNDEEAQPDTGFIDNVLDGMVRDEKSKKKSKSKSKSMKKKHDNLESKEEVGTAGFLGSVVRTIADQIQPVEPATSSIVPGFALISESLIEEVFVSDCEGGGVQVSQATGTNGNGNGNGNGLSVTVSTIAPETATTSEVTLVDADTTVDTDTTDATVTLVDADTTVDTDTTDATVSVIPDISGRALTTASNPASSTRIRTGTVARRIQSTGGKGGKGSIGKGAKKAKTSASGTRSSVYCGGEDPSASTSDTGTDTNPTTDSGVIDYDLTDDFFSAELEAMCDAVYNGEVLAPRSTYTTKISLVLSDTADKDAVYGGIEDYLTNTIGRELSECVSDTGRRSLRFLQGSSIAISALAGTVQAFQEPAPEFQSHQVEQDSASTATAQGSSIAISALAGTVQEFQETVEESQEPEFQSNQVVQDSASTATAEDTSIAISTLAGTVQDSASTEAVQDPASNETMPDPASNETVPDSASPATMLYVGFDADIDRFPESPCTEPNCVDIRVDTIILHTDGDASGFESMLTEQLQTECEGLQYVEGVEEVLDPCNTLSATPTGTTGGSKPAAAITQEQSKKLTAGGISGIVIAGLILLLLAIFLLVSRRKKDRSEEAKHINLEEDGWEEGEYDGKDNSTTDSSGNDEEAARSLTRIVGEDESTECGSRELLITTNTKCESVLTGKHVGQDVHVCASATCEACDSRRQEGLQFLAPGMPSTHLSLPPDATRDYYAGDTVDL